MRVGMGGRQFDRGEDRVYVITNLSFISGKTNRHISEKAPQHYFPTWLEKSGSEPFHAQCIPTDPALLSVTSYDAFLGRRCELVAQRFNEYLRDGHA